MSLQTKLHLSPFVLSTVMFDSSNSVGDQEGFLIGNAQKSVRREISDQSMFNTEEDLIISIYSCIPCGAYLSFYDSCGNVNKEYVEEFLGERRNSVVGWYRYRRNLVAFPSAREMAVHKNLKKLFPGNISFGDEYFTMGVFGSACYPTTATHTYDYTFFIYKAESCRPLAITLLNLGDTKTEYRSDSLSGSFINSTTFDSVLEIPWDFSSCWQTEDALLQMHKMLKEKCDNLAEELAASESVNSIIEQEVQKLEDQMQKLNSELESLTVKEVVEPTSPEADVNISGGIAAEKVFLPFSKKQAKLFGKRNLKDLIDLNEELHPLYGKYFPQNRAQEPGCSYHFSGEVSGINYNFLPPKKKIKVILQERRRILDHDYDLISDEDIKSAPEQLVPEIEESSPDLFEKSQLSPDEEGHLNKDVTGTSFSNIKSENENLHAGTDDAKVKVVFMDGLKNFTAPSEVGITDANISCPESVAEEIVETMIPERPLSDLSSVPSSPSLSNSPTLPSSPSKLSNAAHVEDMLSQASLNKSEETLEEEKGSVSVKEKPAPIIVYIKPL